MNITLAITVWNRWEMLLESFAQVIDDPRIDEIVIMDDHSEDKYWNRIKDLDKFNPKIKVVRQLFNRGMSENKRDAIACSKNDWVIIFDSDNVIGKDYLDAIMKVLPFSNRLIYCPSFAKPHFNYQKYQGSSYFFPHVQPIINEREFSCLLNTANYLVHRDTYLLVWKENKEIGSADSIWFAYLWLKEGKGFSVIPGMEYMHKVHNGSGFLQGIEYNMKKSEEIKKMILEL